MNLEKFGIVEGPKEPYTAEDGEQLHVSGTTRRITEFRLIHEDDLREFNEQVNEALSEGFELDPYNVEVHFTGASVFAASEAEYVVRMTKYGV